MCEITFTKQETPVIKIRISLNLDESFDPFFFAQDFYVHSFKLKQLMNNPNTRK